MHYGVLPGLYAVGSPGAGSPVFVTANYKMSFDALRSSLSGVDAWMLVLDTGYVNVWCAAGKGAFGTGELVSRIAGVKLAEIVEHREVVLPQLGAVGVSALEARKRSGFSVLWGPVRASDIPAWLAAGRIKPEAMRRVGFDLADRLSVAPVEIVHSWPIALAAFALGSLYALPPSPGWAGRAFPAWIQLLGIIPVGTVLFPVLLPWLPSRSFAVKGAFLGCLYAAAGAAALGLPLADAIASMLITAPVVAFLALNFTGASTFTCQPGAVAEVRNSLKPMLLSLAAGLGLAVVPRFLS
jgi:hypothetical protein